MCLFKIWITQKLPFIEVSQSVLLASNINVLYIFYSRSICRLCSRWFILSIKCEIVVISQSLKWRLQMSCFVWTVQNPKIFSCLSWTTNKSFKSSHLRLWNYQMLSVCLIKKQLFDYLNSCRLIFCQSTEPINRLIIATVVSDILQAQWLTG